MAICSVLWRRFRHWNFFFPVCLISEYASITINVYLYSIHLGIWNVTAVFQFPFNIWTCNLLGSSDGKPCISESVDQSRQALSVRHSVTEFEAVVTGQLASWVEEEVDRLTMCGNFFAKLKIKTAQCIQCQALVSDKADSLRTHLRKCLIKQVNTNTSDGTHYI